MQLEAANFVFEFFMLFILLFHISDYLPSLVTSFQVTRVNLYVATADNGLSDFTVLLFKKPARFSEP